MEIYSNLLRLDLVKVENPNVWDEAVDQINVFDKESGDFFGTIYIDAHPRPGIYAIYRSNLR